MHEIHILCPRLHIHVSVQLYYVRLYFVLASMSNNIQIKIALSVDKVCTYVYFNQDFGRKPYGFQLGDKIDIR